MLLYIVAIISVLIGICDIYPPNKLFALLDHVVSQFNNESGEPPAMNCCYIIPNNNFKKNTYGNNVSLIPIEEITYLNNSLLSMCKSRTPFVLKNSESGTAAVNSWHALALHKSNPNKTYKPSKITTIYGEIYVGTNGSPIVRKPILSNYPSVAKKLRMEDDLFPLIGDDIITSTKEMKYIDYLHIYKNLSLMNNMYLFSTNYRVAEGVYGKLSTDGSASPSSVGPSWRDFIMLEEAAIRANITVNNTPPIVTIAPPAFEISNNYCTKPTSSIPSTTASLQWHYSEFHRMMVQLQGSATYLLIAPSQLKYMSVFPSFHTFHGYSQVSYDNANETHSTTDVEPYYPLYDKVKSHRVVKLNASDVLYIPPYWMSRVLYHGVDASDSTVGGVVSEPSVALEVKSASQEQLILMEAFYTPLPSFLVYKSDLGEPNSASGTTGTLHPNEKLSIVEKMVCAQVYIMHILSRINMQGFGKNSGPKAFIARLIRERYVKGSQFHFPDSMHAQELKRLYGCNHIPDDEYEQILSRYGGWWLYASVMLCGDLFD